MGYYLYIFLIASWFLHLPSRVPFLGTMRIDLLVMIVLAISLISQRQEQEEVKDKAGYLLKILFGFAVVTVPFVEWPGSVVRFGLLNFIRVIVFFFFTIHYVTTESRLKHFIIVFLACQSFRVLEPLYLHVTEGYWGSVAYIGSGEEFLNRLSGAPHDIVNPNGLAFIILSILPFFYFLFFENWKYKIFSLLTAPPCIYALFLTGSRTGLLGLFVVICGIVMKSKKKVRGFAFAVICMLFFALTLSPDLRERYTSIIDPGSKHAATFEGRIEGAKESFIVAMRKPIVGHGLGTSVEVGYNYGKGGQIAHNLYAEVAQELGFVGLAIFILYMKAIVQNFLKSNAYLKAHVLKGSYLYRLNEAMQVWMAMNLLFSLASYGLLSYEWYLFGGLSTVMLRLSKVESVSTDASENLFIPEKVLVRYEKAAS